MILKIQRPLNHPDLLYLVNDQTQTVIRHMQEYQIPHRVKESCRFGKAYWTARIVSQQIEFMQQIGPQAW